jgi:ABC-type Fe3+-hydroxamate transport system substrate-binding protein
MRIISLVPSLTKTISDLGLAERLVGVTDFCVDPPDLWRRIPRVGGTKNPDIAAITALNPTHIIVNAEENRREDIGRLAEIAPLLNTFPKSPADVPNLLRDMDTFLKPAGGAREYILACNEALASAERNKGAGEFYGKRFLYLIWRNPWMAVGEDTYISRFLGMMGMSNALSGHGERYPVIEPLVLKDLRPDVVFMSSEPWPFRKRDATAFREACGESSMDYSIDGSIDCRWIDGKLTSWYGSLTAKAITLWVGGRFPIKSL